VPAFPPDGNPSPRSAFDANDSRSGLQAVPATSKNPAIAAIARTLVVASHPAIPRM
jgi:hypothetical protein